VVEVEKVSDKSGRKGKRYLYILTKYQDYVTSCDLAFLLTLILFGMTNMTNTTNVIDVIINYLYSDC
jgi:hypothetical protein